MKILVFDNYDSFTYNLVHSLNHLKKRNDSIDVFRNDKIDLQKVKDYDKIVLSPGPGIPDEAGLLKPLIKKYADSKSILGVCLGYQAIAEVFGGKLINLNRVFHGVATTVEVKHDDSLFNDVPSRFEAGRYHSWAVERQSLPDCFHITVQDETGELMGIAHKQFDVKGVQFHPESVLTPFGEKILANWLYSGK